MGRNWLSYGSDGEPADDVDDDDEDDEAEDRGGRPGVDQATTNNTSPSNLEDNHNDIAMTTTAASSASFMTSSASFVASKSSSLTSSGDVRRPRTTADGCEDESGAADLDLIRHVLLSDSVHHSTSWKALDDAVENSVEELDLYINPQSLVVDSR